jgi:hypothetical protein
MDTPTPQPKTTAQIISLEEVRAKRNLRAFRARVGHLRERVADLRRASDREAPLLVFRRDAPP